MSPARSILLVYFLAFITSILPAIRGQEFETIFSNSAGRINSANFCLGRDGFLYGTLLSGGPTFYGAVFKVTPTGEITTIHGFTGINGANPNGALVQGNDGNFYGTTQSGGLSDKGTIFKVTPAGEFTLIASFNGTNGRVPSAELLLAGDGNIYGTTVRGGTDDQGTIFKLTPDGVLTTLVSFIGANGRQPNAELVEGSDGNFYGTTGWGGEKDYGTIFKMTPAGVLTTLVSFNGIANGSYPRAGLTIGDDGHFYGVTSRGGVHEIGTVFKITSGGVFTTVASFTRSDGEEPRGRLLKWTDGNFYGTTTMGGGDESEGTIFKVTPEGTLTTIAFFNQTTTGAHPHTGLTAGSDGNFYGATREGAEADDGTIFKVTPTGELTKLASLYFMKYGSYPNGGLAEGNDGSFYGTAAYGGNGGTGTAFKVTPSGEITRLDSFSEAAGQVPYAGMLAASDGNFYGTNTMGGAHDCGVIFKVTPAGEFTTLVSIPKAIGSMPRGELVEGSDGNFYGTAASGGANNYGSVFKVTPAGEITLLYSFNYADGRIPTAALVLGSDGNFYGTTELGGANNCGTIFKMTPAGVLTTLYSFEIKTGYYPSGDLLEWTDGNFYGTTIRGGPSDAGTIFKVTSNGEFATIYSLASSDGKSPDSGLVAGNDGNFYGIANGGGPLGFGTIFKVSPTGEFTRLYSFDGMQAAYPSGKPTFGSDGKLYGTSSQLAIWRLGVSIPPTVTLGTPSTVSPTGATLNGTVNANGTNVNITFEYGLTPSLGSSAEAAPGTVTGGSATAVSATITGLLPHTIYHYRLTAAGQAGANSTAVSTFTTGNNLPVAVSENFVPIPNRFQPVILMVLANDSDPDGDPLTISAATQGSFGTVINSGNNLFYTPGPGYLGRDSIWYTVSDGIDTATAQVEIRADLPFQRTLFSNGSEIPGAGEANSEFAEGSVFQSFGVPSINSSGKLSLLSNHSTPGSASELSVLLIGPLAAKTKLAARRRQIAPGTEGAQFASFKDPLLNEAGDVAILATLSGGDTRKGNNEGIWVSPAFATGSNGTQLVARTGAQPPGAPEGARWKSFTSVAFSSFDSTTIGEPGNWWLAFTGFMTTGPGGVKAKDDMGLWIASPSRTMLLLRENELLESFGGKEKRIKTFAALKPLSNTLGQGNGVNKTGGVAAQVFFTDGTQAMLQVSWYDGIELGPIVSTSYTLPTLPISGVDEKLVKFGIPAQNHSGSRISWVGTLSGKVDPIAIFERHLPISELTLLVRQGGTNTGIEETRFSGFGGVAINDSESTLFLGKLKGRGISDANNEGLWWRRKNGEAFSLNLLAREGELAPGVPEGARWSTFSSIALPDGECGPLFTAELTGSRSGSTAQRINSSNDQGLWAIDSSGELRLVIREGQEMTVPGSMTPKKLKSFTVLSAVTGSPTQRRSFDNNGRIVYRALFIDNSQAIVTVQLP